MSQSCIRRFVWIFFTPLALNAQVLQYTITPLFSTDSALALQIDLHCSTSGRDKVWFCLPDKINWTSGLWRCYSNFSLPGGGGRLVQVDSLRFAIVCAAGQSAVHLRYQLLPLRPGKQVARAESLGPVMQPGYLHVPGECLFLLPQHYAYFDVAVEWKSLPPHWSLQNNWASGQRMQYIHAGTPDWRKGIWVAGDFRLLCGRVLGRPVCLAIRGHWKFTDQSIFHALLRTVETQRRQWNDEAAPFYSVTILPFADSSGMTVREILGYGRFQSFAVFAGQSTTAARLVRLFNHEMMHEWIGGQIRDCPPGRADEMNWFTEGFADYYALRNRWKAGFLDTEDFFLEWNDRFVSAHYVDTLGELPETALRTLRYANDRAFKVPYRRGALLAFYFDCAIRRHSGNTRTLHDFMLELLVYCRRTEHSVLDHFDFFSQTLAAYTGEDPTAFLQKHAFEGRRIPSAAFRLPDYLHMETDAAGVPQFFLNVADPEAAEKFLK